MPAGTSFMIEEGALGKTLRNLKIERKDAYDYFSFDLKNTQLHAVHPLGWLRKVIVKVDEREIPQTDFYFILRGQWIRGDHIPLTTDIYWYLCEPANIYVRQDGGIAPGTHKIACTFFGSRIEETQILDLEGYWPLRDQTVTEEMTLEE